MRQRRRHRPQHPSGRIRRGAVVAIIAAVAALGATLVLAADNHGSPLNAAASPRPAARRHDHDGRRPRPAGGHATRRSRAARVRAARARAAQAARARRERSSVRAVLRYTPFVAAGSRRRRLIALTFDDGPSPYTPAIVRILLRMRASATFFVVGQQLNYFSSGLRDEVRHGFSIGDHTENHAWLPRLTDVAQLTQVRDAAIRIERLGAPLPDLFRPPYGAYNRNTLRLLRKRRMLMVMWSIDPGDWRRPGARAIVANVLAHARPGAIVILHDGGGDRSQTVAALPAIIRGLRRRHFTPVSVPQLLRADPPPRHQRLPPSSGA